MSVTIPAALTGCIDLPRPDTTVARGMTLVAGWTLGPNGPVTEVIVLVDHHVAARAHIGLPRPDVAALYPDLAYAGLTGWQAVVDFRAVRGSMATLTVLACSAGHWREMTTMTVAVDANISGRRKRAVFTIVQNEPVFLPLWLRHYGRDFEPTDVYVLDHDSTDGSTDALGTTCRRAPVHRTHSFDHTWLKTTVEAFQSFLLCSYETVLFTEVDELIVADPRRYDGLASYIDGLQAPAACCTGYNVVHQPAEAALRFDEPLLAQRAYWHPAPNYSKRLLARVPLAWSLGFHTEANVPEVLPDPDLLLIHLHRVDLDTCIARNRDAARRTWNQADVAAGLGTQNRLLDDELREWFYRGADLAGTKPEPIPPHIRSFL